MRIKDDNVTQEVKFLTFPGGERMPKLNPSFPDSEALTIQCCINSPSDLFDLVSVVDAIRRISSMSPIRLEASYVFGARQDRVCNAGEPLTAKLVADIINSCFFDNVSIFYPHSDVLPALINNCEVDNNITNAIFSAVSAFSPSELFYVISPDAGAAKRTFKLVQDLNESVESGATQDEICCRKFIYVEGGKKRDVKTGFITHFTLEDIKFDAPVLVVDDICANGGTFLGLYKKIAEQTEGDQPIGLFVAHADHAQGLDKCAESYDQVFTTNSRPIDLTNTSNRDKIQIIKR